MTVLTGLAWLAGIVAIERLARRLSRSRARGWIAGYASLALVALAAGPAMRVAASSTWAWVAGAALAVIGYPLGRWVLGDELDRPPSDRLGIELVALAGVVAPVEELIWGAIIEPVVGVGPTAALFAIKHPLVDGRWRRTLGLFLFWLGLGLVRAVNWPAALVLHVVLNAGGVLLGHARGVDQF